MRSRRSHRSRRSWKRSARETGRIMEFGNVLNRLPHRDPFRFVTHLLDHAPGEYASGIWSVSGCEDFFAGHFPGDPIVPGVLIGEALAQLSGLVGGDTHRGARLAHIDLKIHAAVSPPAKIGVYSRLARSMGTLHLFEVKARSEDRTIADGQLTLVSVRENSK